MHLEAHCVTLMLLPEAFSVANPLRFMRLARILVTLPQDQTVFLRPNHMDPTKALRSPQIFATFSVHRAFGTHIVVLSLAVVYKQHAVFIQTALDATQHYHRPSKAVCKSNALYSLCQNQVRRRYRVPNSHK